MYLIVQLYVSRKKFLKNERESEKWSQVDFQYMTKESDRDDDCISQHKLTWRSAGLLHLCVYSNTIIHVFHLQL